MSAHSEPEGDWFPLCEAEVLACGFTDHVDTGTFVDDATMNVASFDDDFYRGVLRIHEGWSSPWLS